MANMVFANGMELACKAGSGKTICAMPDVCFTPPENPATPPGVPVPYPNTGMDSDTTEGSKTVKISDKEVMLKNKSYFKTSTGDEAGSAAKKGMISSTNKGKVYFINWSMDVKFEGENVDRHMDMTTHNHGSPQSNEAVPWPHVSRMSIDNLKNKPCNKSCPKKPSKEKYKKLRSKSPSDQARAGVNKAAIKTCAACGGNPPSLAADHIVPLKIIAQMPGFACLSEENQEKIANSPENYVGLCTSCNSSKSAKLWHTWKGHQSRGLDWQSDKYKATREKARKITNTLIVNFKAKIRASECK